MEEGRKSSQSYRSAALPKPVFSDRLRIDWNNRRALIRVILLLRVDPVPKLAITRLSPNSAICAGRVKVSAMLFSGWRRMLSWRADLPANEKPRRCERRGPSLNRARGPR